MDPVENLIINAPLTDDDRDIGTSGLCGMFALALYRAVIDQHPRLVLIGGKREGKPIRTKSGKLYWSHAAVKVGTNFYDIDGKQQISWLFSNYAWSLPLGAEPEIIELPPEEFVKEIKSVNNARDRRYYIRWKTILSNQLA